MQKLIDDIRFSLIIRQRIILLEKKQSEQEARRVTIDGSPHSWSSSSLIKDDNPGVITTTPAAIGNDTSLLCDECGVIPTQRT